MFKAPVLCQASPKFHLGSWHSRAVRFPTFPGFELRDFGFMVFGFGFWVVCSGVRV